MTGSLFQDHDGSDPANMTRYHKEAWTASSWSSRKEFDDRHGPDMVLDGHVYPGEIQSFINDKFTLTDWLQVFLTSTRIENNNVSKEN